MMMKRFLAVSSVALLAAGASYGEPQRTLLSVENKFPELHALEVGASVVSRDFSETDETLMTAGPVLRYGLIKNLTAYAEVPFASYQSDKENDDASGLGDIKAGLQLLAWRDVFEYPWVVPHVDVSFDTGSLDDNTGFGKNVITYGITAGSKMYDQLSLALDISYADKGGFESGSRSAEINDEGAVIVACSGVWDVDEQFAIIFEGKLVEQSSGDDNSQPKYFDAGIQYKFTEALMFAAYAGGWSDTDGQNNVTVRATYDF